MEFSLFLATANGLFIAGGVRVIPMLLVDFSCVVQHREHDHRIQELGLRWTL